MALPPPHPIFTRVLSSGNTRGEQQMGLIVLNIKRNKLPTKALRSQTPSPTKPGVWRSYIRVAAAMEICPCLQNRQSGMDTQERVIGLPQAGTRTLFTSHALRIKKTFRKSNGGSFSHVLNITIKMKADSVVWKPLSNLLKPRGNPSGYSWLLAAQPWTSWTLTYPSAAVPRYATACFPQAGL